MAHVDRETLLREADALEPLPASSTRLASIVARGDWDVQEIVEVVSFDPSLTARLLRTANSVVSASREPVTTVDMAVIRMGPGMLLSLAIGSCVRDPMSVAMPSYGISEGELWRHSVASALAADRARSLFSDPLPPETFTAALLHDLGRIVLARVLDPPLQREMRLAYASGQIPANDVEREMLGIDHGELGGLIGRMWGLPPSIVAGIAHHHDPETAPNQRTRRVAELVRLADATACSIGEGLGVVETSDPEEANLARAALSIDPREFSGLRTAVEVRLSDVLAWYD